MGREKRSATYLTQDKSPFTVGDEEKPDPDPVPLPAMDPNPEPVLKSATDAQSEDHTTLSVPEPVKPPGLDINTRQPAKCRWISAVVGNTFTPISHSGRVEFYIQ